MSVAGLLLGGCVSQYGDSAPYLGVPEEAIDVSVPANAPSIRQEFRVETSTRSGNASPYVHEGLDVTAPVGTPVIATASGRVTQSFAEPMYGNQVVIDHGVDSTGRRTRSVYTHLDRRMVTVGATVARGQQIGTLGRAGVLAAGIPHLHFEIHRQRSAARKDMVAVDPNRLWANGVGAVTCFDPSVAIDETVFRATYPVVCKGMMPAPVRHGSDLAAVSQ